MSLRPARFLALAASVGIATLAPRVSGAQPGFGQTFTAPLAPFTQLTAISATGLASNSNSGSYTANIYAFAPGTNNGGTLVGPSLFSQFLGSSFNGFSFTPNITLVGAATYALVIEYIGGGESAYVPSDSYAGRNNVACIGTNCFANFGARDLNGFSVTFGTAPTAVAPEPATWALLGAGLLAVGGAARRRKTRA